MRGRGESPKGPKLRYVIYESSLRSTTARNMALVSRETGQDSVSMSSRQVRNLVKCPEVPENQLWRLPLLQRLLNERKQLEVALEDTSDISDVIDSLCSS